MDIKFYDVTEFLRELERKEFPPFSGNYSTYSRLCLGDIVSDDMRKILYIDSDTMIEDNISELYDSNVESKICLGVWDTIAEDYYTQIGLPADFMYVNAGILLINLPEWKKFFSEEELRELVALPLLDMPDQNMINAALFKTGAKDYVVHPRYNVLAFFQDWNLDSLRKILPDFVSKYYSIEELREALTHPAIIHLGRTMRGRPWYKGNTHPFTAKWMNYLKETGFYADFEPFEAPKVALSFKIKAWLNSIFPQSFVVFVRGLYFLPRTLHKKLKKILGR